MYSQFFRTYCISKWGELRADWWLLTSLTVTQMSCLQFPSEGHQVSQLLFFKRTQSIGHGHCDGMKKPFWSVLISASPNEKKRPAGMEGERDAETLSSRDDPVSSRDDPVSSRGASLNCKGRHAAWVQITSEFMVTVDSVERRRTTKRERET